MAISLLSNLSYLGEDYNFSRDAFKTIAEMKAFDADYLPPMYLSYCEEDGKVYLYNDNNTEDATTGKWRVFGEGGEGTDEIYVGDTQPTDNITMWIDTTNTKAVLKYKCGDEYKAIGGTGGGIAEETTYENTSFDDIENVKQALDKLYAKVYYVPLAFTSFTMTPSTTVYEKGSSVNDVTVTWEFNKDITDQKVWINGTRLYGNLEDRYYRDELTTTSDFELKVVASDGETTVTKSATISFQNKICWGSSATVDDYDSSFILALANKKFATSKAGNLSFNVAENEYGFLAMPSSFGSPTCVINNFETELEDLGTISFTNASGYTEDYKLYKTTQDSLGAFTATIK